MIDVSRYRRRLLTQPKGANEYDHAWIDLVDEGDGRLNIEYCWSGINLSHARDSAARGTIRSTIEDFIAEPPSLIMLDRCIDALKSVAAALAGDSDPDAIAEIETIHKALNQYEINRGGRSHWPLPAEASA